MNSFLGMENYRTCSTSINWQGGEWKRTKEKDESLDCMYDGGWIGIESDVVDLRGSTAVMYCSTAVVSVRRNSGGHLHALLVLWMRIS